MPARVLYAHGFGQTRHAWTATARALAARGLGGMAVDARGHGESDWLPGGAYRLDQFVGDAHALAAQAAPLPVWVGASMGGLVGLIAQAESATPPFSALVLVDITPRWEAKGVDRILSFLGAHPEGFASLADAQRAIDAYLPHRAAHGRSPERLAKLLVRHSDGRFRWHWDPALLATVAPEAPTWTARLQRAATRLDIPVLLISGGRSGVSTVTSVVTVQKRRTSRRCCSTTGKSSVPGLSSSARDALPTAIDPATGASTRTTPMTLACWESRMAVPVAVCGPAGNCAASASNTGAPLRCTRNCTCFNALVVGASASSTVINPVGCRVHENPVTRIATEPTESHFRSIALDITNRIPEGTFDCPSASS